MADAAQPGLATVRPAPGIDMPSNAAATGKRLLDTTGFTWVGEPQPMVVQQMPFQDAARQIPAMSDPDHSEYWPDTPVWLVVLRGTWDLMPMGPVGATLVPNRYEGCLMILFTAQDSQIIAVGDTMCP